MGRGSSICIYICIRDIGNSNLSVTIFYEKITSGYAIRVDLLRTNRSRINRCFVTYFLFERIRSRLNVFKDLTTYTNDFFLLFVL